MKGINTVPKTSGPRSGTTAEATSTTTMFWEIMGPGKGGAPTGAIGEGDQVDVR